MGWWKGTLQRMRCRDPPKRRVTRRCRVPLLASPSPPPPLCNPPPASGRLHEPGRSHIPRTGRASLPPLSGRRRAGGMSNAQPGVWGEGRGGGVVYGRWPRGHRYIGNCLLRPQAGGALVFPAGMRERGVARLAGPGDEGPGPTLLTASPPCFLWRAGPSRQRARRSVGIPGGCCGSREVLMGRRFARGAGGRAMRRWVIGSGEMR